ncbi:protein of unknown function [Streptantibioticus cattleyicolor NRRL 8057 = DSM 46488]|nr:protein of unknown function [Streptantibioticus cattleyicolor NRRL 8057 = DSM 46488]
MSSRTRCIGESVVPLSRAMSMKCRAWVRSPAPRRARANSGGPPTSHRVGEVFEVAGRGLHDLGRTVVLAVLAQRCSDPHPRAGLVARTRADEAVAAWAQALVLMEGMTSTRTRKAITSIRSTLAVYRRRKVPGAADLARRAREALAQHAQQPARRREHRGPADRRPLPGSQAGAREETGLTVRPESLKVAHIIHGAWGVEALNGLPHRRLRRPRVVRRTREPRTAQARPGPLGRRRRHPRGVRGEHRQCAPPIPRRRHRGVAGRLGVDESYRSGGTVTSPVPWEERLSAGTEAVQDDVISWYQDTREGKAYARGRPAPSGPMLRSGQPAVRTPAPSCTTNGERPPPVRAAAFRVGPAQMSKYISNSCGWGRSWMGAISLVRL